MFFLQKVHICMSHSQPINYIVHSAREKTCTALDRFVYFLDYHCIGQHCISSFILYANQTDTKRIQHAVFCDLLVFKFLIFSFLQVYKFTDFQVHYSIDCPYLYGLSVKISDLLHLFIAFQVDIFSTKNALLSRTSS